MKKHKTLKIDLGGQKVDVGVDRDLLAALGKSWRGSSFGVIHAGYSLLLSFPVGMPSCTRS